MTPHPVKHVIEAADRAIVAEDFDALMDFYADDALLVIRPDLHVRGKQQIRQAFARIAEYFNHSLLVKQENVVVLESGSTALALGEAHLEFINTEGLRSSLVRRSTYVFMQAEAGKWVCVIDNTYGTDLLNISP